MAASDCPNHDTLYELLVGTMDEVDLDTVVNHLDGCTVCQSAIECLDESADAVISRLRRCSDDLENSQQRQEAALERLLAKAAALADPLGNTQAAQADKTVVPDRLGEYRLLEKLGEGGMGAVYKAEHTKLKRIVAVKILSADRMGSDAAVARFEREMEAVGGLNHPNIIQAFDAREVHGIHFLVMEYIEGLSLSEIVVQHGPLPIADACELLRQAAIGLQYAHEHGLVHRDIKPSNLMLALDGSLETGGWREDSRAKQAPSPSSVKILDLGLALLLGRESQPDRDLTRSGQIAGTIDYMAPEQCADTHGVDIRADIYSLGATMHKLLVGQAPLGHHNSPLKRLAALATQQAPSLAERYPEASAELVAVVDRMTAKNPEERFSTPGEVAAALEPFCATANLFGLLDRTGRDTGDVSSEAEPMDTAEHLSEAMTGTCSESRRIGRGNGGEHHAQPETERFDFGTGSQAATQGRRGFDDSKYRLRRLAVPTAMAGILFLGVVLTWAFRGGQVVIDTADPNIQVSIRQDEKEITVVDANDNWIVRLQPGDYHVDVRGGSDDFQIDDQTITVKRGSKVRVHITRRPEVSDAPPSDAPPSAVAPFDTDKAREFQVAWAEHLGLPVEYENSIGMKLRLVPAGEFLMGSSKKEIAELLRKADDTMRPRVLSEGPQHTVRITKPFYIGIHEVTVGQFGKFIRATGFRTYAETRAKKSKFTWKSVGFEQTDQHPVVYVNWDDAVAFCQWLSTSEGHLYRLLSEAQWEYACRAGSQGRWCFGDDREQLDQFAWSRGDGPRHVVGQKRANAFGIYDMHGNAFERCQDWFAADYYGVSPTDDPEGPTTGTNRVTRGGFGLLSAPARSALRSDNHAKTPLSFGGIRVVRILR